MLQQFLVALMMQKVSSKKNSLEQLACELEMGGCSVSKQALHKKFNDKGVSFVQGVLEELLRRMRKGFSTSGRPKEKILVQKLMNKTSYTAGRYLSRIYR